MKVSILFLVTLAVFILSESCQKRASNSDIKTTSDKLKEFSYTLAGQIDKDRFK